MKVHQPECICNEYLAGYCHRRLLVFQLQVYSFLKVFCFLVLLLGRSARVFRQVLVQRAHTIPQPSLSLHCEALHVQRFPVEHAHPIGTSRPKLALGLAALAAHSHGWRRKAFTHGIVRWEWRHSRHWRSFAWSLALHHHWRHARGHRWGTFALAHGISRHHHSWHHPRHHVWCHAGRHARRHHPRHHGHPRRHARHHARHAHHARHHPWILSLIFRRLGVAIPLSLLLFT
mmetsp:Transcript_102880/g.178468  ORF Transcript_102880/g.178468 Transcript_102880/m.178468 type:complete len:231 (+) Transcript_102880:5233-5925(+)